MFLQLTTNLLCTIRRETVFALIFFLLASVAAVRAENGDDILGLWYNEEHDGLIEIFRCENKYCGRIVWTKDPNYTTDDKKGRAGQSRKDENNHDPKIRARPIIGLQVMTGFVYSAEDRQWKHGTVYDPKNGKTYNGRITLIFPDKLYLRGYFILPLFGRNATWTRDSR